MALAHVLDVAVGHRLRAGDGLQRGGLAGAVGADQADQFTLATSKLTPLTAWMPP